MFKIVWPWLLKKLGFSAITIFVFTFYRSKDHTTDLFLMNHERIHFMQQLELFFVGFWILYVFEFCIRYILSGFNHMEAYRRISFERECYIHEDDLSYLVYRKPYSWITYV